MDKLNDTMCSSYWSVYRRAEKQTEADLVDMALNDSSASFQSDLLCNEFVTCGDPNFDANMCTFTDNYLSTMDLDFDDSDVASVEDFDTSCGCISSQSDSDSDFSPVDSDGGGDGSDDDDDDVPSLADQLSRWIMDFNVPHVAINPLLRILKPHCPSLPNDVRTLLHTPRHIAVKACGNGEYVHFGLENGIKRALRSCDVADNQEIHLQINVDGLPLFKSSSSQFWPILCLVKQPELTDPFVVGLFGGNAKPPVNFLQDFISELQLLKRKGLTVGVSRVHIKLLNFVCDAPARAFVKCTKLHSGYSSCEKCDQRGEWAGKVIFTPTAGCLRTDEQFRSKADDGHHLHNITSPLTALDVGMVSQFPLDPMHLVYLGVMRRLLMTWLRGPLSVRLGTHSSSEISRFLLVLSPHIPTDFCRRPRSLLDIDRWKATEFRLFLLYCGPVVLKAILKEPLYKHFLLLFVACRILSSQQLNLQFNNYAGSLLESFVQGVVELYGKTAVVYNIHGLLHLAADAERFGSLENFSAFPFENKLKAVKRLVRKPHLALQQVARRLAELERCDVSIPNSVVKQYKVKNEHNEGPVPEAIANAKQFRRLSVNGVQLSLGQRNSCVQLHDNSIAVIKNILKVANKVLIVYSKFNRVEEFFTYPLASSCLGIFTVSNLARSSSWTDAESITRKCVLLPAGIDQPDFVTLPLLHC